MEPAGFASMGPPDASTSPTEITSPLNHPVDTSPWMITPYSVIMCPFTHEGPVRLAQNEVLFVRIEYRCLMVETVLTPNATPLFDPFDPVL